MDDEENLEEDSLLSLFNIRDAKHILDHPTKPLVDIIKPGLLWKGSKLLLSAPKKSGKSSIVQQLAFSLAGICPIFEPLESTRKNKVLYMQFEMHEEIVRERLEATGWNLPEDQVYIGSAPHLKLDDRVSFLKFKAVVGALKPDVLILDPLYNLHNRDENEASDMQIVFDRLDELIRDLDLALILVHHHRKEYSGPGGDQSSPENRARGTSKLQDWPDTLVTIDADRIADTRTLKFICRRNPSMSDLTMRFDPETWTYSPVTKKADIEGYILDTVEAMPIDRAELVQSLFMDLDVNEKDARNAIDRLREQGRIRIERNPGERGRPSTIYPADL